MLGPFVVLLVQVIILIIIPSPSRRRSVIRRFMILVKEALFAVTGCILQCNIIEITLFLMYSLFT